MTDTGPSAGKTWLYRFAAPGEVEIETHELEGDEAALAHAREMSSARVIPIIVERHDHVDWEYITEVDERP
jgi:hypothetical protein